MEIVDGVFSKYQRPEDLTGENGPSRYWQNWHPGQSFAKAFPL
ncbi:hypothetical protein ACWWD9_12180 [Methylovorus sp. SPW-M1]